MNCMNTFKNEALLRSALNSLKSFMTANSDCLAFTSYVYQYISFHVTLSRIVEADVLSTACCYFQVTHKHQTKKLESNIDPVPKRQYNLRRRKKTSTNNSFSDKVLFPQFHCFSSSIPSSHSRQLLLVPVLYLYFAVIICPIICNKPVASKGTVETHRFLVVASICLLRVFQSCQQSKDCCLLICVQYFHSIL